MTSIDLNISSATEDFASMHRDFRATSGVVWISLPCNIASYSNNSLSIRLQQLAVQAIQRT